MATRIGQRVVCTVCGRSKKPLGRDEPAASGGDSCSYECAGYRLDPSPDTLWPGEKECEDVTAFEHCCIDCGDEWYENVGLERSTPNRCEACARQNWDSGA